MSDSDILVFLESLYLCLAGSLIFSSYQGSFLMTELMPWKSLTLPHSSTKWPSCTWIGERAEARGSRRSRREAAMVGRPPAGVLGPALNWGYW